MVILSIKTIETTLVHYERAKTHYSEKDCLFVATKHIDPSSGQKLVRILNWADKSTHANSWKLTSYYSNMPYWSENFMEIH